jgi:hypothetical protein
MVPTGNEMATKTADTVPPISPALPPPRFGVYFRRTRHEPWALVSGSFASRDAAGRAMFELMGQGGRAGDWHVAELSDRCGGAKM